MYCQMDTQKQSSVIFDYKVVLSPPQKKQKKPKKNNIQTVCDQQNLTIYFTRDLQAQM